MKNSTIADLKRAIAGLPDHVEWWAYEGEVTAICLHDPTTNKMGYLHNGGEVEIDDLLNPAHPESGITAACPACGRDDCTQKCHWVVVAVFGTKYHVLLPVGATAIVLARKALVGVSCLDGPETDDEIARRGWKVCDQVGRTLSMDTVIPEGFIGHVSLGFSR